MERLKEIVLLHFERIMVATILLASFIGAYLIEEKSVVLNFFYLPVLVASYFLGRRMGLLTAVFTILVVIISVLVFPRSFFNHDSVLGILTKLLSWGGFLILAAVTVGTLYEQNERRLQEIRNAYVGILEILAKYLESTDRYTKGHSVRVSELAMETAIAMDLSRSEVENIRVAGLLHDIGKIEISGDVLRKAADLTTEERELINSHTEKGAHLLNSVGSVLKEVVPIVSSHHQYFMSTMDGHEKELSRIPLGARIIAVADAFDAMTTDRPYRKGMPLWGALQELVKNAGKQFDPAVVEAFKRVVTKRQEGD